MSATLLAILYAFHLMAAVFLIGGLMMLVFTSIGGGRDPSRDNFITKLERRFTPLGNLSLVVLIATGMLQMSADPNYDGFLQLSNPWAWAMVSKHLAVVGMLLLSGYIMLVLEPERRRLETLALAKRPDEQAQGALRARRTRVARINLGCGLLTLIFTAIATAQ